MVDNHNESNVNGIGSDFESAVVGPNVDAVKANGFASDNATCPPGLVGNSLFTYKRRRIAKFTKGAVVSDDSLSQPSEKRKVARRRRSTGADRSVKHLKGQAKGPQDGATVSSSESLLKHKRNTILEQICAPLDSEGGLKKCIQNALLFQSGSGSGTTLKEHVRSCEDLSKSTLQTVTLHDGLQKAAKCNIGMTSSGSINDSIDSTFTELCRCTFFDLIMSEKFAQLCSLLLENFEGMKAEKLFDLNHINTRMKEKAYEKSPSLFQSDIQEIWAKLQKVGTDITSLAKCLSDKTTTSFREQVGYSAQSVSEGRKNEFPAQESDVRTKVEQTEACPLDDSHTCKCCKQRADGRNGLVCDSCEEIYHITCIIPPMQEIPTRSWYCSSCTSKGTESSHENCVVCERLSAYRDEFGCEETTEELEESSNELVSNGSFQDCKVCRTEVSSEEDYRICGHSFCSHKFYHVRCLTAQQLVSYGHCWYCPSCLCRTCLTDRDDDKIVLCDGCDHAYHIYCMDPPRPAIPKGKWFCQKCDDGIQRIRKARRAYGNMQIVSSKRAFDGKLKGKEGSNKSGGVDMLLNAAKTLNYEENLASTR